MPSFITFWTWLLNQPTKLGRIDDLRAELAVHHDAHAQLRLWILHVADGGAELDRRQLARGDEEDFTDEDVPAGELVDQLTEEWNVGGVECVTSGRETADELSILEEQRHFVGVDGELRLHRNRLIGVLVDPLIFCRVGPRDRELRYTTLDETDDSHLCLLAAGTLACRACGRG
jgi:hypothetical protein